jgi:hypothetical protein
MSCSDVCRPVGSRCPFQRRNRLERPSPKQITLYSFPTLPRLAVTCHFRQAAKLQWTHVAN